MFSSSRIPLASLTELCRALHHSLDAGLSLVNAFRQQAGGGPVAVRPVAARIGADLERGHTLEAALQRRQVAFPPLFLALATVGEQTGALAEVFGELERHFQMRQNLRRQFLFQSARPAGQLLAAVGIIAVLIWALGAIAETTGTPPLDPLGLGYTGTRGAALFLALAMAFLVLLVVLILLVVRMTRQVAVAAFLLRIPIVGPCLLAQALARLSLALRLTLKAAMPVGQALDLSLRATGNAAFAVRRSQVRAALESGRDLTASLAGTGLFPEDFQHALEVAEESGKVPEVMGLHAEQYHEEAERRLVKLTRAATFLIWLAVAVLLAWAIVHIFINVYLTALTPLE